MAESSQIRSSSADGSIHVATASKPQTPSNQILPIERKTLPLSITNLMSPPELAPYETFQHGTATVMGGAGEKRVPNVPLSPPISPFKKPSNTIDPVPAMSPVLRDRDPILYPSTESSSPPAVPLFSEDSPREDPETRRVVDAHIAALPKSRFKKTTPPKREEYELTLAFKSNVMEQYLRDPKGWLNRERANLKADRDARIAAMGRRAAKLAPILPAASRPSQHGSHHVQAIRTHATRVEKTPGAKPRARAPRAPASQTIQVAHVADGRANTPPPRRTIPVTPARGVSTRVSTTPERTVRPSREDKDFNAVVDYCPPLSTLPNRSNCLKVDWKGTPLDLSTDPHRHLLHPEEIHLASSLRLDCATYLTNKRRLFEHRVRCAKIPKEFRKTDAQQACKIDVNKASKLWTAFDKVGWLDIHHFRQFL